jgi:DNA-binding winged helix-turn-helix (wHTH) protein
MQVRFGEFVFDAATRQVVRNDAPIHLSPKAFDLLKVLIEQRPRAVGKAELRDRLWPDVVVQEANLKNLVVEIRAALDDRDASVIRTVHRFGYAFAAGDSPAETTTARLLQGEQIHKLRPGENVIGRHHTCVVVLHVQGVSRRHASIRITANAFVLEDLRSKNGTWRNDEPVKTVVDLQDGDRIRLGGVTLIFRTTAGPEPRTITAF